MTHRSRVLLLILWLACLMPASENGDQSAEIRTALLGLEERMRDPALQREVAEAVQAGQEAQRTAIVEFQRRLTVAVGSFSGTVTTADGIFRSIQPGATVQVQILADGTCRVLELCMRLVTGQAGGFGIDGVTRGGVIYGITGGILTDGDGQPTHLVLMHGTKPVSEVTARLLRRAQP